jgi:hypothetical protein
VAVLEQSWRRGTVNLRPFATQAGVRRLQRALTDFDADEAFGPAARKVCEHYGVVVNAERIRQTTLHHAGRRPPAALHPAPGERPGLDRGRGGRHDAPPRGNHHAPAGADRRRHRQVRWQEARVVAAQAHGAATTHYDATLGGVADAGAPWLGQQAAARFGAAGRYLLDLYHVCDYLAAVWPGDKASLHAHRDALNAV